MLRPDARSRPVGTVLRPSHSPAEVRSYLVEVERPGDAQCARHGPATLGELQALQPRVNPGTATRQGSMDVDDDAR